MFNKLCAEFLGTFWLVLGGCRVRCLPPHFRRSASLARGLLRIRSHCSDHVFYGRRNFRRAFQSCGVAGACRGRTSSGRQRGRLRHRAGGSKRDWLYLGLGHVVQSRACNRREAGRQIWCLSKQPLSGAVRAEPLSESLRRSAFRPPPASVAHVGAGYSGRPPSRR